jgi:hypothetical protein
LTGATKRILIARARAMIGYVATRELSISGSAVARRLNQDRSAVSRASPRVHQAPEMRAIASELIEKLSAKISQR